MNPITNENLNLPEVPVSGLPISGEPSAAEQATADPCSTRRLLEVMTQLQQAANLRAEQQAAAKARLASAQADAEKRFEETAQELSSKYSTERKTLEDQFSQAKRIAAATFETDQRTSLERQSQDLAAAQQTLAEATATAEQQKTDSQWQTLSLYDGTKDRPRRQLKGQLNQLSTLRNQIDGLERDGLSLIELRSLASAAVEQVGEPHVPPKDAREAPSTTTLSTTTPSDLVAQLHAAVLELEAQRIPTLFLEGMRSFAWAIPCLLIAAVPAVYFLTHSVPLTLLGTLAGGVALHGALLAYFIPKGKRQSLSKYAEILQLIRQARSSVTAAAEKAHRDCEQVEMSLIENRDAEVAEAEKQENESIAASRACFEQRQSQLRDEAAQNTRVQTDVRQRAIALAEEHFPPLIEANAHDRQHAIDENVKLRRQQLEQAEQSFHSEFQSLANQWHKNYEAITSELSDIQRQCEQWFPDWGTTDYELWQRPEELPPAIQFGTATLPLKSVRNAAPTDEALQTGQAALELPALMSLAEHPHLVATTSGEGRKPATQLLQQLMLRFLTAAPAGKVRFTAIDASGLGESFAGFMHLSEQHDQLIGKQIWTRPQDIALQLTRLSEHVELVLQKYLRNDYESIHDYNTQAGEVAEPYQVIVVANYPEGFNEATSQRLANLAASGPRCGVHVLMSVDTELRLPHETTLAPFLERAIQLDWQAAGKHQGHFQWKYPLFERLPLTLDNPPPPAALNEILRVAGEQSRLASRVEVPFATVAPPKDAVWKQDSSKQLVVPIGRAGARDLQNLSLGKGTSQHVLISGKTGSGKSTLLHALITNLALHYGPDQLEFYLVDFKKGVEFKAYAAGKLPHARVIAIESEREFGVSVLERLDQELQRRGELFRDLGVQDLAAARESAPDAMLPRTLLIIDEFQELFVADDKLAQDASLLMDRLVRQGRAFGMHVILGSQTLAGAYSLARSTLGQMAVRIALECSEADANLILSDENGAARLLTRPGEAIYNDQNGFVAGNHPFQVVWLPDSQRRRHLARLQELPTDVELVRPIVFEGNAPADPTTLPALGSKRSLPSSLPVDGSSGTLILGTDVRIGPPVALKLQRQSGANVAIVGSDQALALGMLATAVVTLAKDNPKARFAIFDGLRSECLAPKLWQPFASALGERLQYYPAKEAAQGIRTLAGVLQQRSDQAADGIAPPPWYVVVRDLSQLRDLRLGEDDFTFSATKPAETPDKQLRQLLREGPALGIHVLLWCESYNSLTRFVDRLSLREIDYRVALPMSAADSTSLIDSPAAGRLGEHRGLLYCDDLGTQTKFRPYGLPDAQWLATAADSLT